MCLVKIKMLFIMYISSVLQNLCSKLHNQMLFLPLKSIVSKKHMALFTNTALWNLVLSWCISMSQFVTSQRGLTCIRMGLTCITMDLTCIVSFNYCDVTNRHKLYDVTIFFTCCDVTNFTKQRLYLIISRYEYILFNGIFHRYW